MGLVRPGLPEWLLSIPDLLSMQQRRQESEREETDGGKEEASCIVEGEFYMREALQRKDSTVRFCIITESAKELWVFVVGSISRV